MSDKFSSSLEAFSNTKIEKIVRKAEKRFVKRVETSPWAKTHLVVKNSIDALLKGFEETRNKNLDIRSIKVELVCETYDTLMDLGQFFPKAHEIKHQLNRRGYTNVFFHITHVKSSSPALVFNVSYLETEKGDPFTGSPFYEFYKTE